MKSSVIIRIAPACYLPTLFVFALLCLSCSRTERKPLRLQWLTMGTVAAVQCADHASAARARETSRVGFDEVNREFSAWRDDSVLSAINRAAGTGHYVAVPATVATVLETALRFCDESGGAFNPMIGPTMRLWGFNGTSESLHTPAAEAVRLATALADRNAIEIISDAEGKRVRLNKPGMSLDLGGIAKGYAVDLAWRRLKERGHIDTLVDLGGNLRAIGKAAPGRGGWRTGVRNPFDTDGLVGIFLLKDGEATSTSGHYERFVQIDGVRHAHIMDGRTGRPVTGMAGVTVIAPDAMTADALSTALFIIGPEKGIQMLRGHQGCEALWIPDTPNNQTVLATPGFATRLEILRPDAWRLNII